MIILRNLTKTFQLNGARKTVARDVSVTFPTATSVALLGRNGAGKSTLLRMIAGSMDVTSGQILSDGTISWPVGFAGAFHPDMTGAQNTRFIGRIYGADTDALLEFVEEFAEVGQHFHEPMRNYSSGMRSRVAFGVSVGIPFDTYLIDEVTSVGDATFKQKSARVLQARTETSSALVVSHSMNMVRKLCSAGAVLEDGILTYYDDLEEAIGHHEENMGA